MFITGEFIFVIIIFIWLSTGFLGLYNMDRKPHRPSYELILFLFFTPCIPLIAKFCGIF